MNSLSDYEEANEEITVDDTELPIELVEVALPLDREDPEESDDTEDPEVVEEATLDPPQPTVDPPVAEL